MLQELTSFCQVAARAVDGGPVLSLEYLLPANPSNTAQATVSPAFASRGRRASQGRK